MMQSDVEKYLGIFRYSLMMLGALLHHNVRCGKCFRHAQKILQTLASSSLQGRLHCVLYNRENWECMVRQAGLEIVNVIPE
jgi:hypothetical protein